MRCPECGNFCMFSFMADEAGLGVVFTPVYQCQSVPVSVIDTKSGKVAGHTLDHTDHFFAQIEGRIVRVNPVKVGGGKDAYYTITRHEQQVAA